ncbi:hypothetical protein K8R43_04700 [archaeon]|nr:hypothetical protein [archaeon]
MKGIIFFLATKKGYKVIERVVKTNKKTIGAVTSFKETSVEHSYHRDIANLCNKNNIKFYEWGELSNTRVNFSDDFDGGIAIGWKYLLPKEAFEKLPYRLIVIHDSLLPKYRGFAPLPTAIIKGEKTVGATAFFASEELDAGEIIKQEKIDIRRKTYIKEAIEMMSEVYCDIIEEITNKISKGETLKSRPQDHEKATFSAWRGPEDCEINWNKSSEEIYNLIRGVSKPYPGAYTYLGNKKVKIWKSELVEDLDFEIRYPGKVWKLEKGMPIIICGKGMLKITDMTQKGRNIIPLKKMRINLGKNSR